MSFGKNLQYLRRLYRNLTQEGLSEKLNVSRQTVSKWETDDAMPEMDKALELCKIFNCTLDNLFRDEMSVPDEKYSNLRIEMVKGFRYISHTVLSTTPEDDALDRVFKYAKEWEIENPKVIGWDFPFLSPEQINIYHMHGYTAALVLPEGIVSKNKELEIRQQGDHNYAAIHIERPFENPFVTIPGAYRTLMDYMKVNGWEHEEKDVIPCFETNGDTMFILLVNKSL